MSYVVHVSIEDYIDIRLGNKRFMIIRAEKIISVGTILTIRPPLSTNTELSGEYCTRQVCHISDGSHPGLREGYIGVSIKIPGI